MRTYPYLGSNSLDAGHAIGVDNPSILVLPPHPCYPRSPTEYSWLAVTHSYVSLNPPFTTLFHIPSVISKHLHIIGYTSIFLHLTHSGRLGRPSLRHSYWCHVTVSNITMHLIQYKPHSAGVQDARAAASILMSCNCVLYHRPRDPILATQHGRPGCPCCSIHTVLM